MVEKAFKPEQTMNKLREAEVLLSQGATVSEASGKPGVTEQPISAGVKSTVACVWSRRATQVGSLR